MDAKMAAVYDGRVEPAKKLEVSTASPGFHDVQPVVDAKLCERRTREEQENITSCKLYI